MPEIGELLSKARDRLARTRIILAAGRQGRCRRDAYLAGFHAAQVPHLLDVGTAGTGHRQAHGSF
jgi:hypothetical protein